MFASKLSRPANYLEILDQYFITLLVRIHMKLHVAFNCFMQKCCPVLLGIKNKRSIAHGVITFHKLRALPSRLRIAWLMSMKRVQVELRTSARFVVDMSYSQLCHIIYSRQ